MKNPDRAEEIYRRHTGEFAALEREMERAFGIPVRVTADSVKRIVLSQLNGEIAATFLRPVTERSRAVGLYAAAMAYFACMAFAGSARRHRSADVLFEEWGWRNYPDFYRSIHDALPRADVKILWTASSQPRSCDYFGSIEIIDRRRQLRFGRAIARKVLKTQALRAPLYLELSVRSGLDYVDLALRLMRQIATYETDAAKLRATFLVSAADNAYSALRHFIYKRAGIGNLMLIQNGGRMNLHAGHSSYIHCDYYIGWSERRLALFHGMECPNRLPFGSVRRGAGQARSVAPPRRHDIVFIEQIFGRPALGEPSHELYLQAIRNLGRFAILNPALRILYKTRPGRDVSEDRRKTAEIDRLLGGTPVRIDSDPAYSSYDAIRDSRLAIACDSSMRVEALVMGRNVLTLNYARSTSDFLAERPDELGVLEDTGFEAFATRVLDLLEREVDPEVARYFDAKRAGLSGNAENPAACIAEVIDSKL